MKVEPMVRDVMGIYSVASQLDERVSYGVQVDVDEVYNRVDDRVYFALRLLISRELRRG